MAWQHEFRSFYDFVWCFFPFWLWCWIDINSLLFYAYCNSVPARCSLLFVSAADGDLCHTKGPGLLRMAQYLGYCEVWQEWRSHDCSYCPLLRELMANVHVKMISGCTNDRWLYAVDKDLGVHAPQQSDLLLIDNTQNIITKEHISISSLSLSLSFWIMIVQTLYILVFLFPLCSELFITHISVLVIHKLLCSTQPFFGFFLVLSPSLPRM